MNSRKPLANYILIILTCVVSLLPYLILYFTSAYGGLSVDLSLIGSLTWLILVIITLKTNEWQRKLLWLFVLLPVAFGPWLVILVLILQAWLFGFAP